MKPKQAMWKKLLWLPILALLVLLGFFYTWWNSPTEIFRRNQAELELAVQDILAAESADGISIAGAKHIDFWAGDDERSRESPIIEFTTGSFGIVPASSYKGFYYSVDGAPAAFQNSNIPLTETEPGHWTWSSQGNEGTTEHITGNWYTFSASF